jgi:hypothetical protein
MDLWALVSYRTYSTYRTDVGECFPAIFLANPVLGACPSWTYFQEQVGKGGLPPLTKTKLQLCSRG